MPRSWSADISTTIVSPPHDSGTSWCSASCVSTRCGSALSLSILLTATMIGTSAARAWLIASIVCGITPSSAATTSTTMSVTCGAAGAHLRERGVARRVDERELVPVAVDLVGADVLGDAAGLALDDVGRADLVEHRRLAVVDVAHDGDDGRARRLQLLVVVVAVVEHRLQLDLLLLAGIDEQQLGADLEREQLHLLVGERHRRRHHLAVVEQEPHDVGRGAVQLGRELLRRHTAFDDDRALGHGRVARRVRGELRLQLVLVATATATAAAARRTALPARTATGTAGTAGTTARTTGTTTRAPPGPPGRPPGPPLGPA